MAKNTETTELPTDLKTAANYILSHGQQLQAFIVMAQAVDQIDQIERRQREGQAALDATNSLLEKAVKNAEAKAGELAEAQKAIAVAKADAATIRDDARATAKQIVTDAENAAADLVAAGKLEAKRAVESVNQQVEDANASLASYNAAIAEVQSRCDALKAEAETYEGRIADAKAAIRKLAGE